MRGVLAPHTAVHEHRPRRLALASQAFLPLLDPALIAALPITAAHLLSLHQPQHVLDFQYGVVPALLLFITAMLAVRRLTVASRTRVGGALGRAGLARRPTVLATGLFAAELVAALVSSPLGLRYDPALYAATAHTHAVSRILRSVPTGAAVSAQTGILPHLSQRQEIHEFPTLGNAVVVVVDDRGRRSSQSVAAGYDAVLASLLARGYCLLAEDDSVRLYERRAWCPDRPA